MRLTRPSQLRPDEIVLGVPVGDERHVLALTAEDQKHHSAVFGITGSGKSSFIQSLATQYAARGHAFCLIDPHGDLALETLTQLIHHGFYRRPDAVDRLIYLDFGNGAVVPFNCLRSNASRQTIALNTLEAMTRVWGELKRAAAFQTSFLAGVDTLIANDLPLTALYPLYTDPAFRASCLTRVSSPLINTTLERVSASRSQDTAALLRRCFLLSYHDITRLALSQPDQVVDVRRLMDTGTSLIVNLGSVGDQGTKRLLAALLLVQIEQAALSRTDIPKEERRPWTVFLDEWASFAANADTIGSILEQTRKYGLRFLLASQSTGVIDSQRLEGALENCKLLINFGLGRKSAIDQARQMATPVQQESNGILDLFFPPPPPPSTSELFQGLSEDLLMLPTQYAYVKERRSPPIKLKTLSIANVRPPQDMIEAVLAEYKRRYQRSVAEAERHAHFSAGPTLVPMPDDEPFTVFG